MISLLNKILNRIENISGNKCLNICRTLYINFRTQSFCRAIKLPIKIYGRVHFGCLNGKIEIPTGENLIIGRNLAQYVNTISGRISIQAGGVWRVGSGVKISQGVSIVVASNALLEMGDFCTMGDNAKIICFRHIKIGQRTDLTWETQTLDFNSHFTEDLETGEIFPICKEIIIGEYCWIGNRTTIMPGTILPDYTIVASNSLLNKDYTKYIRAYSMLAGMPAKLVKENIRRIYNVDKERSLLASIFQ